MIESTPKQAYKRTTATKIRSNKQKPEVNIEDCHWNRNDLYGDISGDIIGHNKKDKGQKGIIRKGINKQV